MLTSNTLIVVDFETVSTPHFVASRHNAILGFDPRQTVWGGFT